MISSGVSAVVLAAGSSTRMGTAKPLVRIDGKTMLERVLSTLGQSHVAEIVVVLGNAASLIKENVLLSHARVVINESYQEGIASSIRIGLAAIRDEAEAALIVLADQPFIQPATIDLLIDRYRRERPEIAVPVYNGSRGNPVLLDRSVFSDVTMLSGDVGFRAIFGNHAESILKVPVEDPAVLIDLDTPADIQRFEQSETE